MYAQVIVDIVHENVAHTFSYLVPEGMQLSVGQRVEAPFGRMIKEGVIVGFSEECDVPPEKIRAIRAPLEDYPAILPPLLTLAQRMAQEAHCPLAETLRLMLPAEMRGGRVQVKSQPVVQLTIPEEEVEAAIAAQGRSQKRRMLLNLLRDGEVHPVEELRIWHAAEHHWVLEGGQYECQLCSDCETVRLTQLIHIDGDTCDASGSARVQGIYRRADLSQVTNDVFEQLLGSEIPTLPPRMPITLESRFTDLNQTFMGRILYKAVLSVAESQRRRAEKLPDGPERDNRLKGAMFLKRIFESNSLISMSMSAGGSMPYNFAQGFAALANGQLLRGAMCFLRPVKVPPLPRDTKED